MKKIVVPVDFSEQSEYALRVAAALAKKHKAEILALHMLELNQAIVTSSEAFHPEQTVFLIKLAEKRFTEFLNQPYLEGIKITPIVKHFKVFSEVNDVAQNNEADVIVMGSHGTDGLKEIFIGSNAERVVRSSDIPVLVIKKEHLDFKADKFLFASEFKEDSIDAFQKAKQFADMLSSELKLVYINTPGDDFLSTRDANERISGFLKKAGVTAEVEIYNDYSVENGILDYGDEIEADIIGISTHGRKGLSHFFMGSIGEDIANHSNVPVVTFKI
ncbi:universal stress protein [Maribacter polysaccharolyticus]|uniref:universal stress protein n=1 Tax=Maribacter polysaccharolyticus TaxID=3020831 RepID=UPI00237F177F|nr:universal stress protein [Maribacter polysaccharolyticus]MDE3742576.1 universal stress protein [Maribacter polysaccharolyticus]